jgi:hypothetical protein
VALGFVRTHDERLNFTLRDISLSAGVQGMRTFGRSAAWADYDQDGWMDLMVCNSVGPNILYRSNGNGTFTDVSRAIGIPPLAETSFGITWVDYDNDGDQDLYYIIGAEIGDDNSMAAENRLLRNDVNTTGRFTDVTQATNAGGGRRRSWGVCWADYDNDGFLDVYISNVKEPNVLLHNRADGTFEDVSAAAGVDQISTARFPLWLDYNLDGWMDLYVVNARADDRLYRNNRDGTFTDVAGEAGVTGVAALTWAVVADDFNHDGWPDLYVVSWNNDQTAGPAALYINQANGTFIDQATELSVGTIAPSMSVQTADINNDGHADILVGNGGPPAAAPNFLYLNTFDTGTGKLGFVDVSDVSGLTHVMPGRSHGIGLADFDNDGDLDVYISDGGPAARPTSAEVNHFFVNEGANSNNWARLKLVGTRSNRDAVGARVKVVAGDVTQHLFVRGTSGFNSSNEPFLRIGLGAATQADVIEIRWPSGAVQTLENVSARTTLTVTEPGQPLHWRAPSRATAQEIQWADEAAQRTVRFTLRCACCAFDAQ